MTTRAFTSGPALLTIALAPAMAAVWSVGWFIPQDAPAHVYNAEILSRSFDPTSPLAENFAIRWQPIPNWIGHLFLAGLVRIVPAPLADRILTSLTLAGFAASVFWLRNRIAGDRTARVGSDSSRFDRLPAAALSALLAMNLTWLLGFTSFALGACLFPITLGYWWPRRDRMRALDVAGLGLLLVLGYFCHLVSLGLTLMALGILAIATPMPGALFRKPADSIPASEGRGSEGRGSEGRGTEGRGSGGRRSGGRGSRQAVLLPSAGISAFHPDPTRSCRDRGSAGASPSRRRVIGSLGGRGSRRATLRPSAEALVSRPDPIRSAGWPLWARLLLARLLPLTIAALPILPLGCLYLGIAHRSGPMRPVWENLADPLSILAWKAQLSWADPITLMRKDSLPFTDLVAAPFLALAPVFWLSGALVVWGASRLVDRFRSRTVAAPDRLGRGWWMLGAILIVGGVIGPDTMGPQHGNYLPQRVVLFGLVAAAVALRIDPRRRSGRVATAGLVIALALQSVIVWDYALYSDRTAGAIVRAREDVGRGRRVAFVAGTIRSRFRSNPMMHVDNWLGVDTDNIIWGNYETLHYYFPVQFRDGLARPSPEELEEILISDSPGDVDRRARQWADLLARNADSIDVLVTYRDEPHLNAISSRFFREDRRRGDVRILVRDPAPVADGSPASGPPAFAVAGPLMED